MPRPIKTRNASAFGGTIQLRIVNFSGVAFGSTLQHSSGQKAKTVTT
jgi:hypothetical protein